MFVIQVALEDADDNEHNKYGKSIFFPQLFNLLLFWTSEPYHPLNNDRKYHPPVKKKIEIDNIVYKL